MSFSTRGKYHNRRPRDTGESYLDDISRAWYKFLNIGTINNMVTGPVDVGVVTVPVQVGSEPLEKRHTIIIENDASIFLYVSPNSNPTLGVDTVPIPSGFGKKFTVDPHESFQMYMLTSELSSNVKVTEIA